MAPAARQMRTRAPSADSAANHLLRALTPADYAGLTPTLTRVTLLAGDVISNPRQQSAQVYFPETAVLSLVIVMADGAGVEAATVGNEGMAGLASYLGDGAMTTRCLVQISGVAQRTPAAGLVLAIAASAAFDATVRRYTQVFINQIAQSVACNRLHNIDQRCARWLLMSQDRIGGGNAFDLTQEFLSYMLGVRRESVSAASHALQDRGIIRYRRGHITVLDRPALERAACECYDATRAEYTRLYGYVTQ